MHFLLTFAFIWSNLLTQKISYLIDQLNFFHFGILFTVQVQKLKQAILLKLSFINSCSHICLFQLPSTTILPPSQCLQPMSRNATTSFHFCIPLYSLYVRTYTRLTYCISTRLFLLAPMCRDTSWRSGWDNWQHPSRALQPNWKLLQKSLQTGGWEADWSQLRWRHPALRLNFPLENIFAPGRLQNVTEKVQLN